MKDQSYRINEFDSNRKILDVTYFEGLKQDFHCDNTSRVSIVLSGKLKETIGNKEVAAGTGSLVIKPSGVRHKNVFGPRGARIVSILLEDDFILDLFPENNSPWKWYTSNEFDRHVWSFLYELKNEGGSYKMIDSFIDLISRFPEGDQIAFNNRPTWLDTVVEMINDNHKNSSIRVKALADVLDVHPVYLARVFRKFMSCSVKEYISKLRLQGALSSIANSKDSMASIAYEHGYADQSHMIRSFKTFYGMSPGKFRKFVGAY